LSGDVSRRRLVVCVDLDEWYHCRWATGSSDSLWKDTRTFFRDHYGADRPTGELLEPTERILSIFDEYGIKATFFVLGEVATHYPGLVRQIHARGHEIACHGLRHVDLFDLTREQFIAELGEAKDILESTLGQGVIGYRAPNLIIEPWVIDVLEEMGFGYDSSVCPSRSLQGKYGGMLNAPQNPYRLSHGSLDKPGQREIIELPIPSFPGLKLPAASGIMTRVMGKWWTLTALKHALRTGTATYYFHPYELGPRPKIPGLSPRIHLFLRRMGPWMERALRDIFEQVRQIGAEFVRAKDVVEQFESAEARQNEVCGSW
jgi:polysaccharide deacetylase family protein (PEP-CTERM system associated)